MPYEQALTLFDGDEDDKRKAISMVHDLGADAVYEKLKQEMRNSGIKSIPRGVRKTTRSNPSQLTDRELDVLRLLKEGMQNKEIASRLFISVKTVNQYISLPFLLRAGYQFPLESSCAGRSAGNFKIGNGYTLNR